MSKEHKKNSYADIEKGKSPVFKRGNPGRPKGAKDKIARSTKENIEKAFEELGGISGLITWAKKHNYNMSKVYEWYFSMLPKNVDASIGGDLGLTIRRIIDDRKPEDNNGIND